jgi:ATP-dependent Clp protease ATP-binding subunit ClpC
LKIPALRAILEGSDRFITETPFPEKAIELLDAVVAYKKQKSEGVLRPNDVNIVLSERTGVSFAALTEKDKEQLVRLEEIIHENLVNQKAAVSLIAKSLRARSTGVKDTNRPVGSFLFLGPTGVGKTQTAKVLAKVYFGSANNILRFDMAEYSNREGITRLIGSAERNQPGLLTTAIKNRPASLLLLDEIEKAPPEVYNLLLTLLDEGYITDAQGRKVDCRHLFVIATSNAGAEYIREQVGSGVSAIDLQTTVLEHVQRERLFSPEFLNRFDGVVVYEPLTREHLVEVAKLQLADLANNLREKNIHLLITDEAAAKVAEDGYDPAFGARAMRRVIDLTLGDVIGAAIIRNEIKSGDHFKIIPEAGKGEYSIQQLQS